MKKLIGIFLGPALSVACRVVDDVIPTEQLQAFARERLLASPNVWRAVDEASFRDWQLARGLAVRAALLRANDVDPESLVAPEEGRSSEDFPDVTACQAWIDAVPDGKVVKRKRVVQGTGLWLDRISEQDDAQFATFLEQSFEAMLRSVEISRQNSCQLLEPAGDAQTIALERTNLAIAFARRARREGDLRYLNAALKLSDWAFVFHRRRAPDRALARYLISIAEQELAMKVLLT